MTVERQHVAHRASVDRFCERDDRTQFHGAVEDPTTRAWEQREQARRDHQPLPRHVARTGQPGEPLREPGVHGVHGHGHAVVLPRDHPCTSAAGPTAVEHGDQEAHRALRTAAVMPAASSPSSARIRSGLACWM